VELLWYDLCLIKALVTLFGYPSSPCSVNGSYALFLWNRAVRRSIKHPIVRSLGTLQPTRKTPDLDHGGIKRRTGISDCDRLLCLPALEFLRSPHVASARFVPSIALTLGIVAPTPAQQRPLSPQGQRSVGNPKWPKNRLFGRVIASSLICYGVKPSEWEPWLREHEWFSGASENLAENFPTVVEHLLFPAELRKRILLEIMNPRNGISAGYGVLAEPYCEGFFGHRQSS
jgi:hypothetical protein